MMQHNKDTKQLVYDAICTLLEEDKPATRESIRELTGLPFHIIDDRIKVLIDEDCMVVRLNRGLFDLANKYPPPRIISRTINTDGTSVLDFGDKVINNITPKEARSLGQLFMADAFLYTLIGISSQLDFIGNQFNTRLRTVEKQLNKKTTNQNGELDF